MPSNNQQLCVCMSLGILLGVFLVGFGPAWESEQHVKKPPQQVKEPPKQMKEPPKQVKEPTQQDKEQKQSFDLQKQPKAVQELLQSYSDHILEPESEALIKAEKFVNRIDFEQYDEHIICNYLQEVTVANVKSMLEELAEVYSFPEKILKKLSLTIISPTTVGKAVDVNFKFHNGNGSFVFGRAATYRDGDKIDVAYSIYEAHFKFANYDELDQEAKTFLGFAYEEEIWNKKRKTISVKAKSIFEDYFLDKVAKGYKKYCV